jgi:F-type H+-transporting ATPase subunit b
MDELLRQLGDLALGGIPTLILFVILVLAYRFILFAPLMRIRAERRERTAGALEKSRLAIANADVRAQEYAAKLRAARADIFRRQEQRIEQWNAEREHALAAIRVSAQERVRTAQLALASQSEEARRQIEASANELAAQVLAAVLPAGQTAESAQ